MKKFQASKNSSIITTLSPNDDTPCSILIIRSGWKDMYHVITEWGDSGDSIYKLARGQHLISQYGIERSDLPTRGENIIVSKETIKSTPNNMDLGENIRKLLQ